MCWCVGLASISRWSRSDRQEAVTIMCNHQIQWLRSFQRETSLSNATLTVMHACRLQTVSDGNMICMQCHSAEPHTLLNPRFDFAHCMCTVDWFLNYSILFNTALGGATDSAITSWWHHDHQSQCQVIEASPTDVPLRNYSLTHCCLLRQQLFLPFLLY